MRQKDVCCKSGAASDAAQGGHETCGAAVLRFLKNWTLPVAMVLGAVAYLLYAQLPLDERGRHAAAATVGIVQPVLIFAMLFITFCKIDLRDLRPRRWHLPALLFQVGAFALLTGVHLLTADWQMQVVVEAAMLCLICPTATAAAVVTAKLEGDAAGLTAYTVLINLAVGIAVPLLVPLVNTSHAEGFMPAFFLIMGKVFPLLIGPLVAARLLHYVCPGWQQRIAAQRDLAFHIWAVSLALAIAVTTRSIMHSTVSVLILALIAAVSLAACAAQFALGRWLGNRYGARVSAAQALGQKNTVFAIWMGYTFLTPVTSIAGGFYSVWHNVYNSWQLNQKRRNTV